MNFMLIQSYLDKIPKLEDLLTLPEIKNLINRHGNKLVEETIVKVLDKRHLDITTAKTEEVIKKMDFSMIYYIESLLEELKVENKFLLTKIVNCMGIMNSDFFGDKIYSKEVLKEFVEIHSNYTDLRLNLGESKKIDISFEIKEMLKEYSKNNEYLVFSNLSSALYTLLNTFFRGRKAVSSIRESYTFDKNIEINTLLDTMNFQKKVVGSLNRLEINDYKSNLERDDFILYSDFFGNSLEGLAKLAEEDAQYISNMENTIFISDKFYLNNSNIEIESVGLKFSDYLNGKTTVLADLSKLEDFPSVVILAGSKKVIEEVEKSLYYKMFYPSKEVENLLYLSLLNKVVEKKEVSYVDLSFLTDSEKLKKRNLKFIEGLNKKLEKFCDIGLIEGPYFKIDESISYKDAFVRELIVITPKHKNVEEIDYALRTSEIPIICWVNEGSLLINLQLVEKKQERILLETLEKVILK